VALALVACVALAAGAVRAQPLTGLDTGGGSPLDITADAVEFEQARNVYVARGNVVIRQGERVLKADWVVFQNATRHGLASGNVVLEDGPDLLYADFLQFNVDTLQGVVFEGVITNNDTGFRMEGEEIRKTAEQTYVFEDGLFTTCRCPDEGRDPWAIEAETANVEVGGYAVTKNTKMKILGVPVMWFPWFVWPVKNQRQSGLLFPTFSSGDRTGTQIGVPVLWAPRDELNVILEPTWSTKRGYMQKGRLEYVLGEDGLGTIFGSVIPEDQDIDNPNSVETPFDTLRWGVDFEHKQTLPWWDLKFRARGAIVSDNQYPFDILAFRPYRRDRWIESLASLTKHFGEYGSLGAFTAVRWADDLQSPDDQDRDEFLMQRLPEVHLAQAAAPFPWWDRLVTSFDVDYTHYWRQTDPRELLPTAVDVDGVFLDTGIDAIPDGLERNGQGAVVTLGGVTDGSIIFPDGTTITAMDILTATPDIDPTELADLFNPDQNADTFPLGPEQNGVFDEGEPIADKGHRLLVNPRIATPFRLFGALEAYPEVAYHGTFYQSDNLGFSQRSLLMSKIDLRSRMNKRFNMPFGQGTVEHVLEPKFTYYSVLDLSTDNLTPIFMPGTAVPQERIRQLSLDNVLRDPADRINTLHGAVFGVSNRFYTLEPEPDYMAEGEEPEEGSLWVPNRLFGDVSTSLEYRTSESEFGWFVIDGTLFPYDRLRTRFNFGWDIENNQVGEGLMDVSWSHEDGHDASIRYRFLADVPAFFEDFSSRDDRFEEFDGDFNTINQIEIGLRWAITRSWAILYDGTYDIQNGNFLTNQGGLEYISKCRCWAIQVLLENDRNTGIEFGLRYTLIGLGDDTVRPFRGGAFGLGSGGR
jgi:lipopolysaccharide assembly outer membrane protein LptD (OstA)